MPLINDDAVLNVSTKFRYDILKNNEIVYSFYESMSVSHFINDNES
jgi:hypothetical protein